MAAAFCKLYCADSPCVSFRPIRPPAAGVSTAPCSCLPPELPPQLPAEASLPGSLATVSDDGDDDVWDLSGLPEVGPAKAPADNPPHAAKAKRAAISLTMAMPGRSLSIPQRDPYAISIALYLRASTAAP